MKGFVLFVTPLRDRMSGIHVAGFDKQKQRDRAIVRLHEHRHFLLAMTVILGVECGKNTRIFGNGLLSVF